MMNFNPVVRDFITLNRERMFVDKTDVKFIGELFYIRKKIYCSYGIYLINK